MSSRKSLRPARGVTLGALLGAPALLIVGCADILGIHDDSVQVTCLYDSDCGTGHACQDSRCVCVSGCPEGGRGGDTSSAAGEGGTVAGTGGSGAVGGIMTSGGGGEAATAGTRANGGAGKGGKSGKGGSSAKGGAAGEGEAGAGAPAGGASGGAAAGGAGAGGEAGHAETNTGCYPEGCFLCDGSGETKPGSPCLATCDADAKCDEPRSCNGPIVSCAASSCCLALPTPSGSFDLSCDDTCHQNCLNASQAFPAKVSAFALDAFEVTVARFRPFVAHYPESKPLAHSGANPNNQEDKGWHDEWTALLPADQAELVDALSATSCGDPATWTDQETLNDDFPINCVNWYVAQAFCIWDGGRLPTHAEWDYVASGGERRIFPWSNPPENGAVGISFANYYSSGLDAPTHVGSYPSGVGKWLHYDLAGNVSEWVWDGYTDCYSTAEECADCGRTDGLESKVQRGGSFGDDDFWLRVEERVGDLAIAANPYVGFRCARNF